MPYYIYKMTPEPSGQARQLDLQTQFETFQEAKTRARAMRDELGIDPNDTGITIKVMFAQTQDEAEARLSEHREEPILREWEK